MDKPAMNEFCRYNTRQRWAKFIIRNGESKIVSLNGYCRCYNATLYL